MAWLKWTQQTSPNRFYEMRWKNFVILSDLSFLPFRFPCAVQVCVRAREREWKRYMHEAKVEAKVVRWQFTGQVRCSLWNVSKRIENAWISMNDNIDVRIQVFVDSRIYIHIKTHTRKCQQFMNKLQETSSSFFPSVKKFILSIAHSVRLLDLLFCLLFQRK